MATQAKFQEKLLLDETDAAVEAVSELDDRMFKTLYKVIEEVLDSDLRVDLKLEALDALKKTAESGYHV